jgi:hypothetical protein
MIYFPRQNYTLLSDYTSYELMNIKEKIMRIFHDHNFIFIIYIIPHGDIKALQFDCMSKIS